MTTKFNGREVEITVSISREIEDCFIETAFYVDTGEPLTADDMNVLTSDAAELIDEAYLDAQISAGDAAYDAWKDSQYEPN